MIKNNISNFTLFKSIINIILILIFNLISLIVLMISKYFIGLTEKISPNFSFSFDILSLVILFACISKIFIITYEIYEEKIGKIILKQKEII
jgi:hypothetical protein